MILRCAGAVLLSIALASMTPPAQAQDDSLRAELVSVVDADFPQAKAIVNVEDIATGAPPVLAPEDFTVTVNGAPAAIESAELATSQNAPIEVLFIMDTSGSMQGTPLARAKDAAKALMNELAPDDRVAVIAFSDDVRVVLDYTSDRAAAVAAIDGLEAEGFTALYQATTAGAVKAASSSASRRAVILLSDGGDFGDRSIATRAESIATVASAAVPFFVVAHSNDADVGVPGSQLDRPYLQEVAAASGGRYLEAPQAEDLAGLYAGVGRLLRSQYVVTFDASTAAGTPEAVVAVTVNSGGRASTSEAVYRPGPAFGAQIRISGIEAGDSLTEPRMIEAIVTGTPQRVTWYVDDVVVAESGEAPYVYTFDPAEFGAGEHTLRVTADAVRPLDQRVTFRSTPPAGSGGLTVVPIAIGAVTVFAALIVGAFMLRARFRERPSAPISPDQRLTPWAAQVRKGVPAPAVDQSGPDTPVVEDIGEVMGVLISRSGNDVGKEYAVGGKPVSMGSGESCGVRIEDPDLSVEEARIWVRGGHLMLHKMIHLSVIEEGGLSGGWTILDPGDSFAIGQHTFEFRLLPEDAPVPSADTPDVLRDPDNLTRLPQQPRSRLSELMPREAYLPEPPDSKAS